MPSVRTALLLRTDLFRDLESMKPLTIEEGGRQDPFDNRKLQSMMEALKEGDSTTDQYIAGGNVAWVSWSWSSTASVPVYKSSVKWIMHTTHKTPQPINLVVAVDDLFMDQKNGQMKRISPEEDHHAFILATARDLQQDKFQEAGAVAVLAPKYITSQALSCQRRNGEGLAVFHDRLPLQARAEFVLGSGQAKGGCWDQLRDHVLQPCATHLSNSVLQVESRISFQDQADD